MIELILSVALSDEDVTALHKYGEKRYQAGAEKMREACMMAVIQSSPVKWKGKFVGPLINRIIEAIHALDVREIIGD